MDCPKCGFQQDGGTECLRCGIIYARYHPEETAKPSKSMARPDKKRPATVWFRRFYRLFRWICLAGLVLVLFLMLRTSSPPHVEAPASAAVSADEKIEVFQSSLGGASGLRIEMDESELNAWLRRNLALKRPAGPAIPQSTESLIEMAKVATGASTVSNHELQEAQSSVRDVRIELLEDSLLVYALFDFHGMDLSLELEGRPVVRDGYIKLEPTAGKLGSLPLTAGTLQSATSRIFDSPGNKEKFKLSPGIRDICIEQGRLVIVSR